MILASTSCIPYAMAQDSSTGGDLRSDCVRPRSAARAGQVRRWQVGETCGARHRALSSSPRRSDRPVGAGPVASMPRLRYTSAMAGRAGSCQGIGHSDRVACRSCAGVAQLAEQRFCKPLVVGSSPTIGSPVGRCPSGQRGLAVNQVRNATGVRIPLSPPELPARRFVER